MKLLTVDDVASRLGVSLSAVKQLRDQRLLTYFPGRPVLIDETDLQRYIMAKAEADAKKAAALIETPERRARRIWNLRRLHAKLKTNSRPKPKP